MTPLSRFLIMYPLPGNYGLTYDVLESHLYPLSNFITCFFCLYGSPKLCNQHQHSPSKSHQNPREKLHGRGDFGSVICQTRKTTSLYSSSSSRNNNDNNNNDNSSNSGQWCVDSSSRSLTNPKLFLFLTQPNQPHPFPFPIL